MREKCELIRREREERQRRHRAKQPKLFGVSSGFGPCFTSRKDCCSLVVLIVLCEKILCLERNFHSPFQAHKRPNVTPRSSTPQVHNPTHTGAIAPRLTWR